MNHKQNNYLSVPSINKSSSPSNTNNNTEITEDIDMISDGSQSPYFSTDDNSTMSYDNIQYNQSNHSSNSHYTQGSNMTVDMDDDAIMHENEQKSNDTQYPSTMKNNHKTMKPINNQHNMPGLTPHVYNHQKSMTMEQVYNAQNTMIQHGYKPIHRIAKTLQGEAWKVYSLQLKCSAVIKVTNKYLAKHKKGIDHHHKKYVNGCSEDVYNEIQIMNILQHPALNQEAAKPSSMVSLYNAFEDQINIFVVMEDGGRDLLQFVNECHSAIKQSKMYIHEWQETVKLIMRQIMECVRWLHDVKHVCHLDISLENMLISNVEKEYNPYTKTYKISPTFKIKFCDFGVAELFTKTVRQVQEEQGINTAEDEEQEDEEYYECEDDEEYESEDEEEIDLDTISFECSKYCGKIKYEAPEIFNRYSSFDARGADIWSVGVAFFMICIGTAPWNLPCDIKNNPQIPFDAQYDCIVNKKNIYGVLNKWGRQHYVNEDMVDLFNKIFTDHMYRINAEDILSHPWLNDDDEDEEFEFNFKMN